MISALLMLAIVAPVATLGSEMPRWLAWPLGAAAFAYGAWLAWRESSMTGRTLVFPPAFEPVTIDGHAVDDVQLHWRGPLAFVRWRDGQARIRRLAWWPDTLLAGQRRELKLAMQAREAAHPSISVAP